MKKKIYLIPFKSLLHSTNRKNPFPFAFQVSAIAAKMDLINNQLRALSTVISVLFQLQLLRRSFTNADAKYRLVKYIYVEYSSFLCAY